MSGKRRTRSSVQQLKLLTDYMSTHPRLAHGEFSGPQGRAKELRDWEELRVVLNEHGPEKSVEQWKITWRDLRRKARMEGSLYNRANTSTGNATSVPILSDQTAKILGIMGTEAAFGIRGGEESGIGCTLGAPQDLTIEQMEDEDSQAYYEVIAEGTGLGRATCTGIGPPLIPATAIPARTTCSDSRPIESLHVAITGVDSRTATERLQHPQAPRNVQESLGRVTNSDSVGLLTRTTIERQQRRQVPRARSSQFLQAGLETNDVLRDIAKQLEMANRQRAVHSRVMYKERLWRMRQDLFK